MLRPDVVVNCAAWTAVDACESEPDRALAHNGLAVRWLAESCESAGAHLVQIGTDYVFDGLLDRPYHEWDDPSPQSVYGASKLFGEREALAMGTGAAVVRTSWVCGQHGSNMVKTIMRLATQHSELAFVSDQIGHPTFTSRPRADDSPHCRRTTQWRHSCDQSDGRPAGTASPARWSRRWARNPAWCAPSRQRSSRRHDQRLARPTACSTTRCCAWPASPCCATSANPCARRLTPWPDRSDRIRRVLSFGPEGLARGGAGLREGISQCS